MSESSNYTSSNNMKTSGKYQVAGQQKTLEELLKDLLDVQKSEEKRKMFKSQKANEFQP